MNTGEKSSGLCVFRPGQEGYECWLSRGCVFCRERRGFVHTQQLRCHFHLIQQSSLQLLCRAICFYKWTLVLLLKFFQYLAQDRTYIERSQSPLWSKKTPRSLKEMLHDESRTDLSQDRNNKLSNWKKGKAVLLIMEVSLGNQVI